MSTSTRVSDDTKRLLARLKREDETFDELLERLIQSEEPIEIGAWNHVEADRARAAEPLAGALRAVTVLDSSVAIGMLAGATDVVEAVEERSQPSSRPRSACLQS